MSLPVAPLAKRVPFGVSSASDAAVQPLRDLLAAFNEHDADAFAAVFSPDAWFINVLGHRLSGRTEIAEAHRYVFSTVLARSQMRCTDIASRSVNDRVAVVEAAWVSANPDPEVDDGADAPEARRGIMILLLERDDHDVWRIIHCSNSEYPGAA
jgi:uncharacterized protein (TIGR02246 family)